MFLIFLYSYAFEAYNRQDYKLSLSLANQCANNLSHYDLELLLGDIYLKLEDFDKAERHYRNAADMIPCRFVPLQALYDLYVAQGKEENAKAIAQIIIDKPIKVRSNVINIIKTKMKKIEYHQ